MLRGLGCRSELVRVNRLREGRLERLRRLTGLVRLYRLSVHRREPEKKLNCSREHLRVAAVRRCLREGWWLMGA